jgi:hypothetical protein
VTTLPDLSPPLALAVGIAAVGFLYACGILAAVVAFTRAPSDPEPDDQENER